MSAVEVLARHQVNRWAQHDGWWGCTCDGDVKCDAQHQLDALKAAGYAVVELPEPNPINVVTIDMEPVDDYGEPVDPELTIRFSGIPKPGRLFGRRDLAAALLAADAAEGLL